MKSKKLVLGVLVVAVLMAIGIFLFLRNREETVVDEKITIIDVIYSDNIIGISGMTQMTSIPPEEVEFDADEVQQILGVLRNYSFKSVNEEVPNGWEYRFKLKMNKGEEVAISFYEYDNSEKSVGRMKIYRNEHAEVYEVFGYSNADFLFLFEKSEELVETLNPDEYIISKNEEFYELIKSNPIDANYVVTYDAPMQTYMEALLKCEAWNRQIDYTVDVLKAYLSESDYEELKAAVELWHEYSQEEIFMNRELYGTGGLILGSMYTPIFGVNHAEKCKFMAVALLSLEYEVTNSISFLEKTTAEAEGEEYVVLPWRYCIEYVDEFEETLEESLPDSLSEEEVCNVIIEQAGKIEDDFGHDYKAHIEKLVTLTDKLYNVECAVSKDPERCEIVKHNRFRIFATELLNIEWMIDTYYRDF